MPKRLPIGTPVLYTHRACGVVWVRETRERDLAPPGGLVLDSNADAIVDEAHWAWAKRDKRWTPSPNQWLAPGERHEPPRPERRYWTDGRTRPLDRWVYVWPEPGGGYVVGLTFRSEGFRDPGGIGGGNWDGPGDYQQPFLIERDRFPLYEVRRTLRSRSVLCPTWAVDLDESGADWMSYELRERRGDEHVVG